MTKNHLLKGKLAAGLFLQLFCITVLSAQQPLVVDSFYYTGSTQTFVIPSCASALTVQVYGAEGSYGNGGNAWSHGYGGYVDGVMTPTAGTLLYINVGGAGTGSVGGFNGGGNGGQGSLAHGGAGGGASDIRIGGNALSDRIIVAGGGAGGGTSPGAFGGGGGNFMYGPCGTNGVGGEGGWGINPGSGGACAAGTSTSLGAGGAGAGVTGAPGISGCGAGSYGQGGSLGQGGNGGGSVASYGGSGGGINGGGGGGGGVYGGAGGMSQDFTGTVPWPTGGGGGGGSSFADSSFFSAITFSGTGAFTLGIIVFKYYTASPFPAISVNAASLSLCSGASATLSANGVNSYTWSPAGSFGGSNSSVVVVSPTASTQYTVSGTNGSGCVSQTVIAVTVGTIASTVNSFSLCSGSSTVLIAGGATSYTWLPAGTFAGANTSSLIVSPSVSTNYTVMTNGSSGCASQTVFAINVGGSQALTINSSASGAICAGETVILTVTNASNYIWTNSVNSNTYTTPSIIIYPTVTTVYTVTSNPGTGCIGIGSTQIQVTGCTPVEKSAGDPFGIVIYPNPNAGVFTIQSNQDIVLTITNQLGEYVKAVELNGRNERMASVNGLANGVYFISGSNEQLLFTQKIIVAGR